MINIDLAGVALVGWGGDDDIVEVVVVDVAGEIVLFGDAADTGDYGQNYATRLPLSGFQIEQTAPAPRSLNYMNVNMYASNGGDQNPEDPATLVGAKRRAVNSQEKLNLAAPMSLFAIARRANCGEAPLSVPGHWPPSTMSSLSGFHRRAYSKPEAWARWHDMHVTSPPVSSGPAWSGVLPAARPLSTP